MKRLGRAIARLGKTRALPAADGDVEKRYCRRADIGRGNGLRLALATDFLAAEIQSGGRELIAVPAPSSSTYSGFEEALSSIVTNPENEPVVVG